MISRTDFVVSSSTADGDPTLPKVSSIRRFLPRRLLSIAISFPFFVSWLLCGEIAARISFAREARGLAPDVAERLARGYSLTNAMVFGLAMLMWFLYIAVLSLGPNRWHHVRYLPKAVVSAIAGIVSFGSVQLFLHMIAPRMPYPFFSAVAIIAGLCIGTLVTSIVAFEVLARKFGNRQS